MKLAIIGATGSCGRQVAAQILARGILPPDGALDLIGHAGGAHEMELWGLRADLHDADVFGLAEPRRLEVEHDVASTTCCG
jgi:malate dehydrogenase